MPLYSITYSQPNKFFLFIYFATRLIFNLQIYLVDWIFDSKVHFYKLVLNHFYPVFQYRKLWKSEEISDWLENVKFNLWKLDFMLDHYYNIIYSKICVLILQNANLCTLKIPFTFFGNITHQKLFLSLP